MQSEYVDLPKFHHPARTEEEEEAGAEVETEGAETEEELSQ